MRSVLFLTLSFLLAGCGADGNDGDLSQLDTELAEGQSANGVDPVIMAALQDQIMVDPQLAAKSNADAVRPPSQPFSSAVPQPGIAAGSSADDEKLTSAPDAQPVTDATARGLTLAALARTRGKAAADCATRLAYSTDWARRLPADLPLHPDARVVEAAGAEGNGCSLRVVSFYAAQPVQRLTDWYYTRASRTGFSADHRVDGATHLLGGTRKRDGATYMLYLTDRGDGGTDIDMVVTGG